MKLFRIALCLLLFLGGASICIADPENFGEDVLNNPAQKDLNMNNHNITKTGVLTTTNINTSTVTISLDGQVDNSGYPYAPLQVVGYTTSYMQITARNLCPGTSASVTFVLTGDLGTNTTGYTEFFRNSSIYSQQSELFVGANGGGIEHNVGNLGFDVTDTGGQIIMACGGSTSTNTVVTISSGGFVNAGTLYNSGTITDPYGYNGATQTITGLSILKDVTASSMTLTYGVNASSGMFSKDVQASTFTASGGVYFSSGTNGVINGYVFVSTNIAGGGTFSLTKADAKAGHFIITVGTATATGNFTNSAVVTLDSPTSEHGTWIGTTQGTAAKLNIYDGGTVVVVQQNMTAAQQIGWIQYWWNQ